MYFDFEDRYDDHQPIGGALRTWDGVLLSVGVHVVLVIAAVLIPTLDIWQQMRAEQLQKLEELRKEQEQQERPQFVFVQPRADIAAPKPPPRAEASDLDRKARSAEPVPVPDNPLPYARGNSADRVESAPDMRARGRGPDPEPAPETPKEVPPLVEVPPSQSQLTLPQQAPVKPSGGSLGEALKNLQKYVEQESFNNPRGNVQDLGPLQFDTKGVEFGPWIRRFVSQVRRNWFIPYAAMTMRGKVVLTFFVHRNGALTDVQVVQPSHIDSFNTAAVNALLASNPTQPLPPEYPEEKAFFTVSFYYNEQPGR